MWTRTYTHRTTADAGRIWDLLGDVGTWRDWNDGIETLTLDGPVAVGTTFAMTPPGEDTVTSTIVAFEPPTLITDVTEFEGVTIRVEHRLDAAPDGATTIAYQVTVSGDVPDDVAEQIGSGVSADFPDVMRNLAAAAGDGETGSTG